MVSKEEFERIIRGLGGELIETREEVITVKQAARELGVDESQIIKTLVVVTHNGPLLAILDGESRLNLSELGGRLATPEEVRELTGYEVGEVPPVGIPLRTLVDEKVLEKEVVYGGGGSKRRLVRLTPSAIVEYQRAEVAKLRC